QRQGVVANHEAALGHRTAPDEIPRHRHWRQPGSGIAARQGCDRSLHFTEERLKHVTQKMPAQKKIARAEDEKHRVAGVTPALGSRKRILLVDDHPMMRAGLAQLINKQPDMEVGSEAGTPAEALSALSASNADLLL